MAKSETTNGKKGNSTSVRYVAYAAGSHQRCGHLHRTFNAAQACAKSCPHHKAMPVVIDSRKAS